MRSALPATFLISALAAACVERPRPAVTRSQAVHAPDLAARRPEVREAYERLARAARFTDAAIYDGGATPNEVVALRILAREADGAALFRALESEATLPGRLFAMCALWELDPANFAQHLPRYRASDATVFFQTGCTGLPDVPVRELVERPDGARLAAGQHAREWAAQRADAGARWSYDLVGGGWTDLLLHGGGWGAPQDESFSPEGD